MDWIPWNHGEIEVQQDNSALEQHIASEYRKWAEMYHKQPDAVHFEAFKRNYLDLLDEAEEGHGGQHFFQLNQYGDMTQEEHRREMFMLEAYYNWCQEYNKRQDPRRFEAFKLNLLQAVIQQTNSLEEGGREIQLGAFADCNPHSRNHCVEPLNYASQNDGGGGFLPTTTPQQQQHVQQIGHGVYVEDQEYNDHQNYNNDSAGHNDYYSHEYSSEIAPPPTFEEQDIEETQPTFLHTMQNQKWHQQERRRNASPYSNLSP
eukprot:CAMPEP_0113634600 /NCGR_PEP_ID=MMETSP0017_2-20120614/18022_1 /TAXON_ID=2856 /ORGANISM="Cylindrotheca closterium" /LENGTH=259 /DNA_ID=CAMNT_0000545317 /DNA_START=45 /DNA_END=824 /DNA_ORIENTATION=- /assembly_acc=CAM_ASM_000147